MSKKIKHPPPQRDVLRLPAVQADYCPLSESQLRHLIATDQFPAPIAIGPRAIGWLRSDLEAWRSQMTMHRAEQLKRRREARRADTTAQSDIA